MKTLKHVIIATALLVAPLTQAELLEKSFHLQDGKTITHDTTTGLDWLDVSFTRGVTVNSYFNDHMNIKSEGFRFATQQEILQLLQTYLGPQVALPETFFNSDEIEKASPVVIKLDNSEKTAYAADAIHKLFGGKVESGFITNDVTLTVSSVDGIVTGHGAIKKTSVWSLNKVITRAYGNGIAQYFITIKPSSPSSIGNTALFLVREAKVEDELKNDELKEQEAETPSAESRIVKPQAL